MDATPFAPGERLAGRHQPRGGYGHVWPVYVTVVRRRPKRVLVEARSAAAAPSAYGSRLTHCVGRRKRRP